MVEIRNRRYRVFPYLGIINWLIMLFIGRNVKDENCLVMFKGCGWRGVRYKTWLSTYDINRFISLVFNPSVLSDRAVTKSEFFHCLKNSGFRLHSGDTLEVIQEKVISSQSKIWPCISNDGRACIGWAELAPGSAEAYDNMLEQCLQHAGEWYASERKVANISQISSLNKNMYDCQQLLKKMNIDLYNDNIDWEEFGVPIMDSTYDVTPESSESVIFEICLKNEMQDTVNLIAQLRDLGIQTYAFDVPSYTDLSWHTEDEDIRFKEKITAYSSKKDEKIISQLMKVYGKHAWDLALHNELGENKGQYFRRGITRLKDSKGEYYNVVDGCRLTIGNKGNLRKLHVFGPCVVAGVFAPDESTIPSIIQKVINNQGGGEIDVINHGIMGFYRSYIPKVLNCSLHTDDIVVFIDCFSEFLGKEVVKHKDFISLLPLYEKRPVDIFFEQPIHMSVSGNLYIGNWIGQQLVNLMGEEREHKPAALREIVCLQGWESYQSKLIDDSLIEWKNKWNKFDYGKNYSYGAIVMNCNPITKGHVYLIECSRMQVDFLYVFVVEEDKSFFPFEDRFEMVKAVTEKYENVCVMPSNKWILSNATMPEYFTKEKSPNQIVCSVDDIEIFGAEIAPLFFITKRFVGEEPVDLVTRQYNEGMKRVLPKYGVELVEIPRLEMFNEVVSASRVRKHLLERNYDKMYELMPKEAADYILKNRKKLKL